MWSALKSVVQSVTNEIDRLCENDHVLIYGSLSPKSMKKGSEKSLDSSEEPEAKHYAGGGGREKKWLRRFPICVDNFINWSLIQFEHYILYIVLGAEISLVNKSRLSINNVYVKPMCPIFVT